MRGWVAFKTSHLKQSADETSQTIDLLTQPGRRGVAVLGRPGELGGEAEPRQRRPQLVGNVLQQAPLGGEQRLNPFRHLIEGPSQVSNLVAAPGVDSEG